MSQQPDELAVTTSGSLDRAAALIGRLFDVARPDAVFGEAISAEGQTVITASEVYVGMGFGLGLGRGGDEGQARSGRLSGASSTLKLRAMYSRSPSRQGISGDSICSLRGLTPILTSKRLSPIGAPCSRAWNANASFRVTSARVFP